MEELLDALQLSFGQVAWALCQGQTPDAVTLDRLRYLRNLDVPFGADEREGSGNRKTYGFDHLVECALGLYSVRQRFKPMDVARVLTRERKTLRKIARDSFLSTPRAGLDSDWVKSRGAIRTLVEGEVFIRLHDKASERPGTFEVVSFEELKANPDFNFGDLIERLPNGEIRPLVPLKRVMLPAVAWALEAPVTRPGPQ